MKFFKDMKLSEAKKLYNDILIERKNLREQMDDTKKETTIFNQIQFLNNLLFDIECHSENLTKEYK